MSTCACIYTSKHHAWVYQKHFTTLRHRIRILGNEMCAHTCMQGDVPNFLASDYNPKMKTDESVAQLMESKYGKKDG